MLEISTKKVLIWAIALLLLLGNIFLISMYFVEKAELQKVSNALEEQTDREEIIGFTGLFIEKVLKAEKDVDFETRLSLETAVRELDDDEILAQWQEFTGSQTKESAQNELKNLLALLVKKMGE